MTSLLKKCRTLEKSFSRIFFIQKNSFFIFFSITIRSKTDRDSGRMNNLETSQVRIKKASFEFQQTEGLGCKEEWMNCRLASTRCVLQNHEDMNSAEIFVFKYPCWTIIVIHPNPDKNSLGNKITSWSSSVGQIIQKRTKSIDQFCKKSMQHLYQKFFFCKWSIMKSYKNRNHQGIQIF